MKRVWLFNQQSGPRAKVRRSGVACARLLEGHDEWQQHITELSGDAEMHLIASLTHLKACMR